MAIIRINEIYLEFQVKCNIKYVKIGINSLRSVCLQGKKILSFLDYM